MNCSAKSIAALIMLVALATNAYLVRSYRLDPKNVSTQEKFLFDVKVGWTRQNTAKITVTVKPKKENRGVSLEGDMFVFDGESEIRRASLSDMQGTNLPARYEYEVASNLVTHSQFVCREV